MIVSVVSPKKIVYEDKNAKEVILPSEDGEIAILDFHQPLLSRLKAGIIRIKSKEKGKVETRIEIKEGIAKIEENNLVVMIETSG